MLRKDRIKKATYNYCPTCGGPIQATTLTVNLDTNIIGFKKTVVKVPPRYAEIVSLLVKCYPNTLPRETIAARIWPLGEVETKTIDTTICLARRFLEQLGWNIKAERNIGYRLEQL